jgi:hypothetical protein
VCLGVDSFHTPDWLRDAALEAFSSIGDLDVNTPFSGTYVPLRHHRRTEAVTALMVEIRRDVYMTEPGGAPDKGVDTIVRALTGLVDTATAAAHPITARISAEPPRPTSP